MVRRGPETFYSGKELEMDLLGKPRFPAEFTAAVKKVSEANGYVPRDVGMGLIRRFSPEDPTNPSKDFARELRMAVMEELGLEDGDELRFFSAVGTAVDHFHGTDAWIEVAYTLPGRTDVRYAVVTLDATLRKDKLEEGHKADLVIPDMPDADDPQYLARIEEYGSEVAQLLEQKLPRTWQPAPASA